MKELQQVDLKPAAWNKLYLYDVVKIFLSDSMFFSFRYKNYIMVRNIICFSQNNMIEN